MIQRFLYLALQDGINQFSEDPTLFDQLFQEGWLLRETEVDAIKVAWAAKTPKILHSYAPRDIDVPVFSIVVESENETLKWLNDDIGQIEDPEDPDFGADQKGSIWTHQYQIIVQTEHVDLTTYYYEIAKSILLASNDFFVEQELFDIDVAGAPLTWEQAYIPEHMFARKITFSCSRCFERIDRESAIGKAFRVEGIHVDRSGSSSDVGGVKTLVTPYVAEE